MPRVNCPNCKRTVLWEGSGRCSSCSFDLDSYFMQKWKREGLTIFPTSSESYEIDANSAKELEVSDSGKEKEVSEAPRFKGARQWR